eukprot:6513602-Lingulodinium_polyedra.AAC.1
MTEGEKQIENVTDTKNENSDAMVKNSPTTVYEDLAHQEGPPEEAWGKPQQNRPKNPSCKTLGT